MPLPTLQTFSDTVDWSKTVEPYLPQLYGLPTKVLSHFKSHQGLLDLYVQTNPFIFGLALSILFGAIFLVVAEVNKNYSQVDRCWSILPTFYVAHFDLWARLSGIDSSRIDLILIVTTLWSARLTFNYWRKGGYQIGSEDYRWKIVQDMVPVWAFKLLNITFISFIQSILLFSLSAPVYAILLSTQFQPTITGWDIMLASCELGLLIAEWVSDQQQWDFQNAKKEYQKTAKVPRSYTSDDIVRGFVTSGLWAWSRHPNFAVEQGIWLLLGYWNNITAQKLYGWTLIPSFSLIILFQGSTWLTERITAAKYPEYKEYQRQVGMFVPNLLHLSPYQPPNPCPTEASELVKKKQK